MDWTGGARRRYAAKGKGNEVLRKQKAHFAKVRAGEHPALTGGVHGGAALRQFRPPMLGSNDIHFQRNFQELSYSQHSAPARSKRAEGNFTNSQHSRMSAPHRPVSGRGRGPYFPEQRQTENAYKDDAGHLSTRQRLLARSDWLGLNITRPVQVKFPQRRDVECIGKRRKIEKRHAPKTMPREVPLFQPATGALIPPFEPFVGANDMNGDIRIKVGTDAFASQTQRSHGSRPLLHTSIAPISSAISEESMLLDPDNDGFQTQYDGQTGTLQVPPAAREPFYQSLVEESTAQTDGFQMDVEQSQRQPSEDSFESLTVNSCESSNPLLQVSEENSTADEPIGLQYAEHQRPYVPPTIRRGCDSALQTIIQPSHCEDLHEAPGKAVAEGNQEEEEEEEDDEAVWKQLMHIRPCDSSNDSVVVLRSSSPHITQPSDLLSPSKQSPSDVSFNPGQVKSLPGFEDEGELPAARDELRQPPKYSDRPFDPAFNREESNSDDSALWRKFVLCSQSTQQGSSLAGKRLQHTSETEAILPLGDTELQRNSEQPRSDQATLGGSVYAAPTRRDTTTHSGYNGAMTTSPCQTQTNASMIAHATTIVPSTEECVSDIEEEPSPPRPKPRHPSRPNRTTSVSKLDPKRFKQSRSRAPYAPLPRVVPRFLPTINTDATAKARRSVYDLEGELEF